jgi:hypothetical protein
MWGAHATRNLGHATKTVPGWIEVQSGDRATEDPGFHFVPSGLRLLHRYAVGVPSQLLNKQVFCFD